ncbi:MAG TPA: hypothetical protein VK821_20900 [Dehalococcoidia bacterium]|nr:hypothetical protein [Dehalococcoidia bacterium]
MSITNSPPTLEGTDAVAFVQEVESVFQLFWGGHYEVVKTFFSKPRPREQLIAWLELQLYKEIHIVPGKAREIIELYEKLDVEVERGEFEAEVYELADEVQHYRRLADVLELITAQRRPALDYKATPEQKDLEGVRRKYAQSNPLVRSIGGFAPGGGTAFAAAGAMIGGGSVERQLAEAFQVIYRQELEHYNKNRFVFDRLARETDAGCYGEALQYAGELARQHFLLRNASFSYPLSPQRVAEIEAGQVDPYVPPRLY